LPQLNNLIEIFEQFAPPSLAEAWDNTGLQVGDPHQSVERMLVSLNASAESIREAAENKCSLLFTHHPLFFQGPTSIIAGSSQYDVLQVAFRNNISIYSAHTNLDKAGLGLNKALADFFKLKDAKPLIDDTAFIKLVFFAPSKHSQEIIGELSAAGAGIIGDYSSCSFSSEGKGTFIPAAGAKPTVGEVGKLNRVEEERLEMLVHRSVLAKVVERLSEVHPYEEAAYDIYPLEGVKKSHLGLGRIGNLSSPRKASEIASIFQKETASGVKYSGDSNREVKRVAVMAGSGASAIETAASKGAELLITADVKYHEAQRAASLGLNLVVASHYALEKLALNMVTPLLADFLKSAGYSVEVINSKKESDVWFED